MTPSITFDSKLKKLTVRNVSRFPEEIYNYTDKLEILDISHNGLTELPDDLPRLTKMRIAFASSNHFTQVPPSLAACESLEMIGLKSCGIEMMQANCLPRSIRGIILTDNKLKQLPDSIGNYEHLQKLMLTGNRLTELPRTLLHLNHLELLRISNNHLQAAPAWLAQLPRLAWYSDSGNDFADSPILGSSSIREFDWHELTIESELGQSAKNTVYLARLSTGEKVAIKIFGQGITTDGLPQHDIAVSLFAGEHPHIISSLGKLVNSPDGQQGLVMKLVPKVYTTLGMPPDLITLTRDCYVPGTTFSPAFVLEVARSIARALGHLHSRGITHGDVYAHNILTMSSGRSKLGDFEASSLYDATSPHEQWRQNIDIAGYGHLLNELAKRTTPTGPISYVLEMLALACHDQNSSRRPSFSEICAELDADNKTFA